MALASYFIHCLSWAAPILKGALNAVNNCIQFSQNLFQVSHLRLIKLF